MSELPSYDDLPLLMGDVRHAWDVLPHDLGTLSLCTPERTAAAARLVRTGEAVPLNLPLDQPDPPLFGRAPYKHHIVALNRNDLDDTLDGYAPQGSSQWDGLRHVRAREHGFFGGITDDFEPGAGPLGIEHWGAITGRGVLVDLTGPGFDPLASTAVQPADLQAALDRQGVAVGTGDILLVRTGWPAAWAALPRARRVELAGRPPFSGLTGSVDMARFLWDLHIAALGSDNPAVEVSPGDPAIGSLHRRLLPSLGFALAELLDLEVLAERCRASGTWDFLFVAAPLPLPGGVGSPSNAVAIL